MLADLYLCRVPSLPPSKSNEQCFQFAEDASCTCDDSTTSRLQNEGVKKSSIDAVSSTYSVVR